MRHYRDPEDYFLMWLRDQKRENREVVDRLADLRAFDRLPVEIRRLIEEAPVELVAASVLSCIKVHGSADTAAALRSLMERWELQPP